MCCTHLHNHIPTQNSTVFIHIEWEPVNWHRLTDGPTHPPPTLCDKPAVRNALLMIKPHWRKIYTKANFSVMELLIWITWKHKQTFAGISFQSSNIFYYQWCECVCMYMCGIHVLCVVSMYCISCPFITLPLLVLLHKSCVPHQLTHDAHNMTYAQYYYFSTFWPFFPLLLIYLNDMQLPTITYQHRIAEYLHT